MNTESTLEPQGSTATETDAATSDFDNTSDFVNTDDTTTESQEAAIVVPESDPAPESLMAPESESFLATEHGASGDDRAIEPQILTCESIDSSDVLVCVDDATETPTAPPLALPISPAVDEPSPTPVSKAGRVNKRPTVNKTPVVFKRSMVSKGPFVNKGSIVNVDFAPDLDAHSLLLGASLAVVRRDGRAAFIEVVPGAMNSPRTSPTSSRHEDTDAKTPTTFAPTNPAPPFRYLQAHDFGDFMTKLCALFNEPVRPDLIAVHGFDFLFQTETPHGQRGGQAKETPLTGLDDTNEEAVARAGLAHLRHWLGAYTGVSQLLDVPLWLSCSRRRDQVASDAGIVGDAGIDREFFYRELRSLLFSGCARTLRVDNPGKKGKSKGKSGETNNLCVNLYHFAELRGQACTSLTTGALDVAALLEDLG